MDVGDNVEALKGYIPVRNQDRIRKGNDNDNKNEGFSTIYTLTCVLKNIWIITGQFPPPPVSSLFNVN